MDVEDRSELEYVHADVVEVLVVVGSRNLD